VAQPESFVNFRPLQIADQAAEALREAIRNGVLRTDLPGEHQLARQLGISPPTIHKAFKTLVNEGLISIRHGRRARILAKPRRLETVPTVCVIAPRSRSSLALGENPMLQALRIRLMARGIRWDEIFDAKLSGWRPDQRLRAMVAKRPGVCWLLVQGTAALQRWFEKSGHPSLVLGSCYPGALLPSMDLDYRALGWHAAGMICRYQHRHVALVLRDRPLPGDVACREGLSAYLLRVEGRSSLTVLTAGSNALDLQSKLEHLLSRQPRPTVIVTSEPEHTQTLLMFLSRRGLSIPRDMSVVSTDSHPLFEMGFPELTRYRRPSESQLLRTIRMVQNLLAGQSAPAKPLLITPTFVPGKTLAPPP